MGMAGSETCDCCVPAPPLFSACAIPRSKVSACSSDCVPRALNMRCLIAVLSSGGVCVCVCVCVFSVVA